MWCTLMSCESMSHPQPLALPVSVPLPVPIFTFRFSWQRKRSTLIFGTMTSAGNTVAVFIFTTANSFSHLGLSKDISFIPYLLNDLQHEKSYSVIPYIYYVLSNIGVDKNGGVIGVINSRIDDFYDEKLVLNGLYALYNINNYTNGEYVDQVFNGIEKILNGGYSRVVQNKCYEILKKLK